MRKIILNEKQLDIIKESNSIGDKKMTFFSFESNIKNFLSELLKNPIDAKLTPFLIKNGLSRKNIIDILLKRGVLEKTEKIVDVLDDNGVNKDIFSLKYNVIRKDFDRKLKKIYYKLFEKNVPTVEKDVIEAATPIGIVKNITEDGEGDGGMVLDGGGGATGTEFDGAGQYSSPLSKPIRRKITVTQEQLDRIIEATTTSTAGDYQYDAPVEWFKGDEAYIHRKVGGIACSRRK